jgi:predicted GNAT family acetyltransferase
MPNSVRDNAAQQRYEMDIDGQSGFVTYRRQADIMTLVHAEVPHELSGHGLGSALAAGTLQLARSQGYKIVARCPFIANYIQKHPEFHDLLAAAPAS